MPKPIKRHPALQPISREHHHGLLLCWKIRQGLHHGVAPERIRKYTDWFWEHHLQAHFALEESSIFPILGPHHRWTKRALQEHGRLKRLFSASEKPAVHLSLIEKALTNHIRFEERILFGEIEKVATGEQLKLILQAHSNTTIEDWGDAFWKEQTSNR